jgi:hypothetical protein
VAHFGAPRAELPDSERLRLANEPTAVGFDLRDGNGAFRWAVHAQVPIKVAAGLRAAAFIVRGRGRPQALLKVLLCGLVVRAETLALEAVA